MTDQLLDQIAALVMRFEGCSLRAYPDPASPLYRALAARGLVRAYMAGRGAIPELRALSGAPWTIGWGETAGVREGDVWTQEQADSRLRARLAQFLTAVYQRCPQLFLEPDGRVIACSSLAYNIGIGAFGASTVCRCTRRCEYARAADAFLLWDKAGGRRMAGLRRRRECERAAYLA
jgi:lysozyme